MQTKHTWSFSTIGGMKRVNIDHGEDLQHLHELDQKLWTTLSCPVKELEIDDKTLSLFDTDKDGQIRVPEVLAALKWILGLINNPNDLLQQSSAIPLSAINIDCAEGKKLYASAKIILSNLNKTDSESISTADTADIVRIFKGSAFNGDGIITPKSAFDNDIANLIADIISCVGAVDDRSGESGIDANLIDTFFVECEQYTNWYAMAEADLQNVLVFGEKTDDAYTSYIRIKSKVDDYFLRCRLAEFDPAATEILNTLNARVESIATKNLSMCVDEIASYPIAKIAAGKSLDLNVGINPTWQTAVLLFKQLVMEVLWPQKSTITEHEWKSLETIFAPYVAWQAQKPTVCVEQLGLQVIKSKLSGNAKGQLIELVAKDLEVAEEANSILLVDQLVRYYKDMFTLLKNFVTFYDFYAGNKAIFQAGTLYIDQRSCDLCIKVSDMTKHNAMASFSGLYLIYCDCTNKASGEKITIAAALTNGDTDHLIVGMNALFYDRSGKDWDATVVKIIDNPISISQAFWSPYRKVSQFVEKQINKLAAEKDSKFEKDAQASVSEMGAKVDKIPDVSASSQAAQAPFDIGKFVGIFAAISLAIGAIGTALVGVVAGFISLSWWQMPLAIMGVMLVISGPAMILAYLKLRKRNLAPLLDANGWAINAKAGINIAFGNTLTHLAVLPPSAKVNLNDPFTNRKFPLKLVIALTIALLAAIYYFRYWR